MEEQRARQQAEGGGEDTAAPPAAAGGEEDESSEEALLQRALAMSMDTGESGPAAPKERDLGSMTEEEQIAYAMQVQITFFTILKKLFVFFSCSDVHG